MVRTMTVARPAVETSEVTGFGPGHHLHVVLGSVLVVLPAILGAVGLLSAP
jgi:hypothetical protein